MPHWVITWPMTTTRLSRNSASALSLWSQVALIIKGMEAMCSPDVRPLGMFSHGPVEDWVPSDHLTLPPENVPLAV